MIITVFCPRRFGIKYLERIEIKDYVIIESEYVLFGIL